MNELFRELAPISAKAWEEIEDEARQTLKRTLAGRRVVDFVGPRGWNYSAVNVGRTERLSTPPGPGIESNLRTVQPLVEFRIPFELSRRELETISRGGKDADLDPVREAALEIALAEDRSIFHGYAPAGIQGINEACGDTRITLSDDYTRYPAAVAEALSHLRREGIAGPYAIALGPRCFTGLTETTTGGYPVLEHVRRMLNGPIIWAPGVDGASLVSMRGGDFELTVGQDFSIGYLEHDATTVKLYIQESFTFRVLTPEAAVYLTYTGGEKK